MKTGTLVSCTEAICLGENIGEFQSVVSEYIWRISLFLVTMLYVVWLHHTEREREWEEHVFE